MNITIFLQALLFESRQQEKWEIQRSILSASEVYFVTIYRTIYWSSLDFPGGSDSKASVYNAGDPGLIPGLGRSPWEGNGNPLQDCCLENPMDRGAWSARVHGVEKSRTQLSDFTSLHWTTGGEGDDRGRDGWMASPTWWTWVWATSGSWWWRRKPGVLQSMGSQRVGHDWETELNGGTWIEFMSKLLGTWG